ncbi:MAG TPA: MATE family efflux transporter [Candidatus Angelobacter sp.]|nr:MATE family efflux transporter [Candidatus Angelobacter sp.]
MSSPVTTRTESIAHEASIAPAANWLALIKEALFGSKQDFTTISMDRAIFLLAVPMVLEMAMEALFGIVDIFFVAHLGADATATVGITEGMLTMVMAIAIGMSMGTTAVVARRTGERDPDGAARAAMQSMILGISVSALIFAFCFPFAPKLLALMGASPSILHTGSTYTRIMTSGSGIILMLFLINAIFRGAGDAAVAMRVLWLANVINLCLDPCLILGLGPFPRLGVTGAAVSTSIGRSMGILFQVYLLWRGRGRIKLRREHLGLDFKVMTNIIRIAANGVLQFMIATASWVLMVRLIQSFGSAATAGYTVAIRIVIFSILPSWGLGSAAATLVGQNLGAKHPDRAEHAVWRAAFFNMIFLGSVSLLFLLFAPHLIGIFSRDPNVIKVGATCLRIISLCYILYAYGMVIVQAFNGAGDTLTPTMINLVCFWIIQLPLAYLLGRRLQFGPKGVFWAICCMEILLSLTSIHVFRLGRWKRKMV